MNCMCFLNFVLLFITLNGIFGRKLYRNGEGVKATDKNKYLNENHSTLDAILNLRMIQNENKHILPNIQSKKNVRQKLDRKKHSSLKQRVGIIIENDPITYIRNFLPSIRPEALYTKTIHSTESTYQTSDSIDNSHFGENTDPKRELSAEKLRKIELLADSELENTAKLGSNSAPAEDTTEAPIHKVEMISDNNPNIIGNEKIKNFDSKDKVLKENDRSSQYYEQKYKNKRRNHFKSIFKSYKKKMDFIKAFRNIAIQDLFEVIVKFLEILTTEVNKLKESTELLKIAKFKVPRINEEENKHKFSNTFKHSPIPVLLMLLPISNIQVPLNQPENKESYSKLSEFDFKELPYLSQTTSNSAFNETTKPKELLINGSSTPTRKMYSNDLNNSSSLMVESEISPILVGIESNVTAEERLISEASTKNRSEIEINKKESNDFTAPENLNETLSFQTNYLQVVDNTTTSSSFVDIELDEVVTSEGSLTSILEGIPEVTGTNTGDHIKKSEFGELFTARSLIDTETFPKKGNQTGWLSMNLPDTRTDMIHSSTETQDNQINSDLNSYDGASNILNETQRLDLSPNNTKEDEVSSISNFRSDIVKTMSKIIYESTSKANLPLQESSTEEAKIKDDKNEISIADKRNKRDVVLNNNSDVLHSPFLSQNGYLDKVAFEVLRSAQNASNVPNGHRNEQFSGEALKEIQDVVNLNDHPNNIKEVMAIGDDLTISQLDFYKLLEQNRNSTFQHLKNLTE